MTFGWGRKIICVASNGCLMYFGFTLLVVAYDCARSNNLFALIIRIELNKLGLDPGTVTKPNSVHVSTCSKIYLGGCYVMLVATAGLVGAMYDFTILLRISAFFYSMFFIYLLYHAIELYYWRKAYTPGWNTLRMDKWYEKTFLPEIGNRKTISLDIWHLIFKINRCDSSKLFKRKTSFSNLTTVVERQSSVYSKCKKEIVKTQGNLVLIALAMTSVFALGGAATAREVIRLRCSCQGMKYRNLSSVPYITIGAAPQAPPHLGCVLRSALMTHTYRVIGPTWKRAYPCPQEDICEPIDYAGGRIVRRPDDFFGVDKNEGEKIEYLPVYDETILQIPCSASTPVACELLPKCV